MKNDCMWDKELKTQKDTLPVNNRLKCSSPTHLLPKNPMENL